MLGLVVQGLSSIALLALLNAYLLGGDSKATSGSALRISPGLLRGPRVPGIELRLIACKAVTLSAIILFFHSCHSVPCIPNLTGDVVLS